MTASTEESGQRADQKMDDIVRDADEFYNNLRRKHANDTRLDVAVVNLVVWFSSFAAVGLSAFALYGREIYHVFDAFFLWVGIATVAWLFTDADRRKRGVQ